MKISPVTHAKAHGTHATPRNTQILDEQLRPLRDQLGICVGQTVPDFNTFHAWMTERIIVAANERGELLWVHLQGADAAH